MTDRSFDQLVTDALAKRARLTDEGTEPYEWGTLEITHGEYRTLLDAPAERSRTVLTDRNLRLCGLKLNIA